MWASRVAAQYFDSGQMNCNIFNPAKVKLGDKLIQIEYKNERDQVERTKFGFVLCWPAALRNLDDVGNLDSILELRIY